MNNQDVTRLKHEFVLNTLVNQELFGQWVRHFFLLNHELHNKYDTIYQSVFYVKFYELITIGLTYIDEVLEAIKDSDNKEKIETYEELKRGIIEFKSEFSIEELEFIEYKRHSASHIFQHHYETRLLDNGRIQTKRKEKELNELHTNFENILLKHGTDKGFDEYMTRKLYIKIVHLYNNLQIIRKKYLDHR
jgi:hypothetical protein